MSRRATGLGLCPKLGIGLVDVRSHHFARKGQTERWFRTRRCWVGADSLGIVLAPRCGRVVVPHLNRCCQWPAARKRRARRRTTMDGRDRGVMLPARMRWWTDAIRSTASESRTRSFDRDGPDGLQVPIHGVHRPALRPSPGRTTLEESSCAAAGRHRFRDQRCHRRIHRPQHVSRQSLHPPEIASWPNIGRFDINPRTISLSAGS